MSQLPVNRVVNVNILTTPTFPTRRGFGLLLIIGTAAILSTAERSRAYSDIDGVAADFGTNTEEYKAAQVFFSQSPNPHNLRIGRRFATAVAGENVGSLNHEKVIATWQAVTTGKLSIAFDGAAAVTTANMTFATDQTLNAVAARIQAALITAGAVGVTCQYNGTRFVIRSGTTGVSSQVSVTTNPGTGTYIGTMLGMDAASKPILTQGAAAEDASTALQKQQDYNTEWYGVGFTNTATEQDLLDAAAWSEARIKIFGYTTADQSVRDPLVTDDIASQLKEKAYRRTFGMFDADDNYAAFSAMARAFAVNFNMQNSTITLKFKTLPGVTPESLTVTDANTLDSKNINYYTYFGESAMVAEGKMANGVFFDEVHGIDWLQNAIETNVFGYLYTRTTKVPQTDRGMVSINQQVVSALDDGVNNGLLAPGTWNGDEFGQLKTGDFLKTGYYTYAQPMSSQNISDRQARKAPPIQVAAKGAGAIHFVDISVNFDR
ncbi:MAG: DUF3383 domain-containing protein [Nevskiaceae bacterium]|nr:MAG: DUF3383 domain-containing protein [Nevskiaceae bacterium]